MLHPDLETSGQDPGHLLIVVEEVQDTQKALHQEASAAVVMTMMTSTDLREGELLVRNLHVIIHLMATTDHQGHHEGPGADHQDMVTQDQEHTPRSLVMSSILLR